MHRHYSTKYGIQIPSSTEIGPGFQLCHGISVIINGTAKLGSNVTIHQFLTIGSEHEHAAIIEDGVTLEPNVTTIENVRIGRHSKIGAGSVVTHDIPPNSIAVGVPAKVIKNI